MPKPLPSRVLLLVLAASTIFDIPPLSQCHAQGTAFTYQGQLSSGGAPANGLFDLTFALYGASNAVGQVGGTLTNLNTGVTNGLFAVTLDFGPGVFRGQNLWLQMGVRTNSGDAFAGLTPLQPILPVPCSVFANGASNLLGTLPAVQLSGTLPLAQLPSAVVTNNQTSVTVNGVLTTTNVNAGTGGNLWVLGSSGGSSGGNVTIGAGNAGVPTGGAGGNLNLLAGNAMASGGSGYGGLGPAGNVNITAGAGYNSTGGNVVLQSGGNSPWNLTANSFSKVSLQGVGFNAGDGATVDVEGGHNTAYGSPPQYSSGGNVRIAAGSATGSYTGGNILLLPGTGSPNGNVGVGKTNPATTLDVAGTVTATSFAGSGSGLTALPAAQLAGTVPLAQLPSSVMTNNSGLPPSEAVLTNIPVPGYANVVAVNPVLNKIYLSGGASSAQPIVVVDGNTFAQTSVGSGMGADVDVTNNNYWSGGVYSDNVTVWNSSNVALASMGTGSGCTFEASVDAPHRRVWTGGQCGDSIYVFNADTFAPIAGPISPGGTMGQLVVNPATGRAYFNGGGASKRVNPSTFAVTANAFGTVFGVNAQANRLYAFNSGNVFQILDGSADPEVVLASVTLGTGVAGYFGVNSALNQVYIQQGTNLVTLDGTTGATIASLPYGGGVTGVGNIAADTSRNRVYAITYAGGTANLSVIQVTPASGASISGTLVATSFSGGGSGLTNVPASAIVGGLTTNLPVLMAGGKTNVLCFTNGLLMNVQ